MSRSFLKKIVGNLTYGIVASGVLFIVLWVSAIAPGTIKNPTFSPTEDDVVANFSILCDWTGWHAWGGNPNGQSGDQFYSIGNYGKHHAYSIGAKCVNGIVVDTNFFHVYYN